MAGIEISLKVSKALVYNEVAKTTAYTGAKASTDEDTSAYDRIFTTEADKIALETFWSETANAATNELKEFITAVSSHAPSNGVDLSQDYEVALELSSSFDPLLKDSIESSLFSFFVAAIVSKWFKYTNKDDIEEYEKTATGMMLDVRSKVYFRKKPKRVIPTEE